ncbi:MAG: Ig-like domain-containing protein [Ruminococcus sp.]|nr:Ig-like domain-containing protein [Ruminococcus sp.]
MGDKKSNTIYIIFSVIVAVLFIFFIMIPITRNNGDKRYSVDYNKKCRVGEFDYKISDATYLKDTKELYFVFSSKLSSTKFKDNDVIKPKITNIELCYKNEKGNEITEDVTNKVTEEKRSDISKYITIPDASDKYIYVRVDMESAIKAYDEPDTTDEFGDTVKGEHHKKEVFKQYVIFDYNDIKVTDSATDRKNRQAYKDRLDSENETDNNTDSEANSYEDDDIVVSKKADSSSEEITETTTKKTTITSNESDSDSSSDSDSEKAGPVTHSTGGGGGASGGGYSGGGGGSAGGGGSSDYYNNNDYSNDNNDYNNNNDYHEETTAQTTVETTKQTTKATTRQTTKATTVQTDPPYNNVRGLKIECDFENNDVQLTVDETTQLKAIITPENANNKELKWESNKESIATVDKDGKVKAISKGKAIIKVTSVDNPSVTASIMITVS